MIHIHVKTNYGGAVTQERRILPGVYALDDPRLYGAGQYLLDNGHAVAADGDAVAPAPPPVTDNTMWQSMSADEDDSFAVVEPVAETVEGVEDVTESDPVEGEQVGGFEGEDEAESKPRKRK